MTLYLVKFSYTSATWASFLTSPEDRREALAPLFEAAGGKLHGLWYAFGDADGYVLAELPNSSSAVGTLVRVAASGAGNVSTTVLITVEEMLGALREDSGAGYRPPGSAPGAG